MRHVSLVTYGGITKKGGTKTEDLAVPSSDDHEVPGLTNVFLQVSLLPGRV